VAAFDLLARKAWSARDLARRLTRRGVPDALARAVVGDLEAKGYVNDTAFAEWWAATRARARKLGSVRLRRELLARGIPSGLAAAAIEAAFEEAGEADHALEAARRRLPALLRSTPERAPARLRDFLLRRGYPAGVVVDVVRRLVRVPEDDDPGT
jgi:regulatory protein